MIVSESELSEERALVIDSNPTSRSILIAQLKEFGVKKVSHCTRAIDARKQIETARPFDVILCEQHLGKDTTTGQDLIDDLRRSQLLPFSTIFIMVTAEASYAKVAEAAESALDGYLLKPHTGAGLVERLKVSRQRKVVLGDIFKAIEDEDFARAAELCLERFESRGQFWIYAARIGAELLLRLERYAEAQALFEAVVATKALPWARLGVARALLDAGEVARASTTLERLVAEEPGFADAYDVLGRAQFELGHIDRARDLYRMACDITPHSINRLQNLAMVTYYSGKREYVEENLGRAARSGLDSKMFDPQSLVLLGFVRLETGDRKGLKHCQADFSKLLKHHASEDRYRRLSDIVDTLVMIMDQQFSRVVDKLRAMVKEIDSPEFDFESAANFMSLLSLLASKTIHLEEMDEVIERIGMRFCTSRGAGELLAGASVAHPPYAELIRACNARVLKIAEKAMTLSIEGNPSGAVKELLAHGQHTRNAKLIETAYLVLQRYAKKIPEEAVLRQATQEMRNRFGIASTKAMPGEQLRQPGSMMLRNGPNSAQKGRGLTL